MSFQIHALPVETFKPLFGMSEQELARINAARIVVDEKPGYPCRVSLADAEVGETVILLNHEHQPAESPYRASHAIFVREHAGQAFRSGHLMTGITWSMQMSSMAKIWAKSSGGCLKILLLSTCIYTMPGRVALRLG
jgi:hypothetical protein